MIACPTLSSGLWADRSSCVPTIRARHWATVEPMHGYRACFRCRPTGTCR
ncbi:MAG: hypothetical protein EPN60_00090 [Nevskiaceae bacterium]|nr:MAG: hypothetical protein EPO48_12590 [Nevskiaceae bacterium]TAM34059.1 MAG: hypothetical protein EPN60_00090 [Nevskiaceae bacterium]